MQYFLAKTDPTTYSIDDLERDGETIWDGVRNFQAVMVIKTWKVGDVVYVYHSQSDKKIMGVMKVVGEPYKDPRDERGIAWAARVQFVKKFAPEKQISLQTVKESGLFTFFPLVTQGRLSTMQCPESFVKWVEEKTA